MATRSSSDKYRREITCIRVLTTGAYRTLAPPLLVTTRPSRHRFPVLGCTPAIRHASALPTPRAISRPNCSRFAASGGRPPRPSTITTPDLQRCDGHQNPPWFW